jgi:hypothetical protein
VSFPVPVVKISRLCHCHHETAVLHSLQSDEAACELLDLSGPAVHNDDFKARIVIEMCVTGRDHQFVMGMLQFRQLLCDAASMMIVDKGHGADYRRIGAGRPLGHEAIADQVTKGFGSVCVSKPGDEIVEALEEIGIECNTNSTKDTHDHSSAENQPRMQRNTICKSVTRHGRSRLRHLESKS